MSAELIGTCEWLPILKKHNFEKNILLPCLLWSNARKTQAQAPTGFADPKSTLAMARFRRYAHSLASGYIFMVANILYTLCSVPLAVHFLSEAEFGLWALATQIGVYIALIDLGMASATSRIFVDYKDQPESFSTVVRTAVMVNVTQAVLVLLAGGMVGLIIGPLLKVPPELQGALRYLIFGQCALLAATFATRIFAQGLVAHQRADIANYAQAGSFVVSYLVLWLCFHFRVGVYSIIPAQAATLLTTTCVYALACTKLGLLPRIRNFGPPDWEKFRELFAFGKDMFLFGLGTQLVNASQIVIVSRTLGLEAAAVWSICTRSFILMGQLVGRVLEFAAMPLSEMLVRGETDRFLARYRDITVLSTSMAIAASALFISCNQSFVALWAGRQFTWWIGNDVFLGTWFILITLQRCHVGLLGVTKQLHIVKYVYLAEGLTFIALSLLVIRWGGLGALIGCSIVCTIGFTLRFGLRETRTRFGLGFQQWIRDWFGPNLRLLAWTVPIVMGAWIATESFSDMVKLILRAIIVSSGVGLAFWRTGLSSGLQSEIIGKSPAVVRPALTMTLKLLRRDV
jgi:O-antigen/teichoic acid export membrane protein